MVTRRFGNRSTIMASRPEMQQSNDGAADDEVAHHLAHDGESGD